MHPAERVRIVVETARAVLHGRLEPAEAARVLELQRDQIGDLLRSDRLDVTRSEAESVSLTLRRLAEQIADADPDEPADPSDAEHRVEMAARLGALAQMLR